LKILDVRFDTKTHDRLFLLIFPQKKVKNELYEPNPYEQKSIMEVARHSDG